MCRTSSKSKETLYKKWTDNRCSLTLTNGVWMQRLASSKNVKVSADCRIDPALLFPRFLVVFQTGNLRVDDVMSYELCLYPMSLKEKASFVKWTNRNLPKQSETTLKQNQIVVCSKLFQSQSPTN